MSIVKISKMETQKTLGQAQRFPDDREPWLQIQPLERAFGEYERASDSLSRSWGGSSD
jgi:hypothetical protein